MIIMLSYRMKVRWFNKAQEKKAFSLPLETAFSSEIVKEARVVDHRKTFPSKNFSFLQPTVVVAV